MEEDARKHGDQQNIVQPVSGKILASPRRLSREPTATAAEWIYPCEKALALYQILTHMREIQAVEYPEHQEKSEDCKAIIKMKKAALEVLRRDFSYRFAPATSTSNGDYCDQQLAIWGKGISSKLWWETNGFLISINHLPLTLLQEILFHLGVIHQIRLRFVCKLWSDIIMSPSMRRGLTICLDETRLDVYARNHCNESTWFFHPVVQALDSSWTSLVKLIAPMVTSATDSVVLWNGAEHGQDKSMKCPDSIRIVLIHRLARLLRQVFNNRATELHDVIVANFRTSPGEISRLLNEFDTGHCTLVRCSLDMAGIPFFADWCVFSNVEARRSYPSPYTIRAAIIVPDVVDYVDGAQDGISYLGKAVYKSRNVEDIILFTRYMTDEQRLAVLTILTFWEEDLHIGKLDLSKMKWKDLKLATLMDIRTMMELFWRVETGNRIQLGDVDQHAHILIDLQQLGQHCSVQTIYQRLDRDFPYKNFGKPMLRLNLR